MVPHLSGCVVFGRVSGDSAAAYLLQQASSADKATSRLGAVAGHLLETRVRIDPAQSKVHLEFSWDDKNPTVSTSSFASSAGPSSSSPPQMNAQKTPEAGAPAQVHATKEEKSAASAEKKEETANASREFTAEEVAKHNKKLDIWVIVNGQVLDVTNVGVVVCLSLNWFTYEVQFLPDHPGGEKAILLYAGRDATEEFNMLHDPKVRRHSLVSFCLIQFISPGYPALRT